MGHSGIVSKSRIQANGRRSRHERHWGERRIRWNHEFCESAHHFHHRVQTVNCAGSGSVWMEGRGNQNLQRVADADAVDQPVRTDEQTVLVGEAVQLRDDVSAIEHQPRIRASEQRNGGVATSAIAPAAAIGMGLR